ncbi:MAG: hypothetical protein G3M78_03545 [Candidatus Nitrohelix vancouverensis]|uniref:Uncharacterized protein n=1 Tax=Candidatus Nitrohelix vancouverensis TaxID=2705534 RepID=A0A7T0G2P3_9BACT|nr:MAG: hypothetical protein G3M78_03545 [Candidatus Nitrohelix vancouverensis]
MNICFQYLYRDYGNFKNWGDVIFSNPNGLDIGQIKSMLEKVLIDQAYFVASKVNVPNLYFEDYKENLDHVWHEFFSIEYTDEKPNDIYGRTIEKFVESI